MTVHVTTNNQPRPVFPVFFNAQANEWQEPNTHDEYAQAENDGGHGFRYRGELYSLSEFENVRNGISVPVATPGEGERDELARWDGVQADSYWSATVVRYTDEYDAVIVGRLNW